MGPVAEAAELRRPKCKTKMQDQRTSAVQQYIEPAGQMYASAVRLREAAAAHPVRGDQTLPRPFGPMWPGGRAHSSLNRTRAGPEPGLVSCAGEKKDAIDHWASEVRDLEKQIVKARNAVEQGPATCSYFVFFHRCRGTLEACPSVCTFGCAVPAVPSPPLRGACGSWTGMAICWVGIC